VHDPSLAERFEVMAAQATAALRRVAPAREWLDELLDPDGDGLTSGSAAYISTCRPTRLAVAPRPQLQTDGPIGILMTKAVWLISLRRLLDSIELRDGLPARLAAQSRADKMLLCGCYRKIRLICPCDRKLRLVIEAKRHSFTAWQYSPDGLRCRKSKANLPRSTRGASCLSIGVQIWL
jgi:hypothetical protein